MRNEGSVLVATNISLASVMVSSVLVVMRWQSKRCGDSHEKEEESVSCSLFEERGADFFFVSETESETETSKSSIILPEPSSPTCTGND